LHLPRGFLEIPAPGFAREPLELARGLFGLLRKLALCAAALRGLLACTPLAFELLLLPSRQLAQSLERRVHTLLRLLPLSLLHCLVLVAQLVQLQLEQVGQVLGIRCRTTAAASALLLHRDLDVTVH